MHKTTVTAHAGALNTKDNTLNSVKTALACGAAIFEVDVRFLPDGMPAIDHNKVGPESVKLEEVFALMRGSEIQINLDMKENTDVPRMAELVAQYGLQGRAFMTGLSKSACRKLRGCGLPYYLNGASAAAAKKLGAAGININYLKCTEKRVRAAHERGLSVSVWTVNSPEAMRNMLRRGADNITTRCPDVLLEIIRHAD